MKKQPKEQLMWGIVTRDDGRLTEVFWTRSEARSSAMHYDDHAGACVVRVAVRILPRKK